MLNDNYIELLLDVKGAKVTKFEEKLDVLRDKVNATGSLLCSCIKSCASSVAFSIAEDIFSYHHPPRGVMIAVSLSFWVLLLSLFPVKIVIVVPGASKVVITLARNKHLANEDRSRIEHLLRQPALAGQQESLKKIAHILGKSTSTISREIKKHSVSSDKSAAGRIPNRCVNRRNCSKFYLCEDKPDCKRQRCSTCKLCNRACLPQAGLPRVC